MKRHSSKNGSFPTRISNIYAKVGFAHAAEGDEVHVHEVRHDAVGALLIVVIVPAAKVYSTNSFKNVGTK